MKDSGLNNGAVRDTRLERDTFPSSNSALLFYLVAMTMLFIVRVGRLSSDLLYCTAISWLEGAWTAQLPMRPFNMSFERP